MRKRPNTRFLAHWTSGSGEEPEGRCFEKLRPLAAQGPISIYSLISGAKKWAAGLPKPDDSVALQELRDAESRIEAPRAIPRFDNQAAQRGFGAPGPENSPRSAALQCNCPSNWTANCQRCWPRQDASSVRSTWFTAVLQAILSSLA
jgi:hypothetical protein